MAEARVVGNTAHSAGFLADAYVLVCNTAFLREAGATEPPRTLDDFAEVARKMTDAGRNRFGYYALGATGWSYNQWTTWMLAHGGLGTGNGYFDAGGKCVLRGDRHVAGLQRWLDLYQKDKVSPTASATGGWQDSANAFNAGQLGMVFGWMGLIGNFAKSLGPDRFVVARPPAGPAGQFFYVGGNGYAINRQSQGQGGGLGVRPLPPDPRGQRAPEQGVGGDPGQHAGLDPAVARHALTSGRPGPWWSRARR